MYRFGFLRSSARGKGIEDLKIGGTTAVLDEVTDRTEVDEDQTKG